MLSLTEWKERRDRARESAGAAHAHNPGAWSTFDAKWRRPIDAAIEAALGPPPPPEPPEGWMDSASTLHLTMWQSGQIVLVLRNWQPSDLRIIGDPQGMRDCIDRFLAFRAKSEPS